MKDMIQEQLIRATYVVAKFKDPETAKLLTELAGRLDCALVAARTACLERDSSVRAEIEWEKAMMQALGTDGIADVVIAIEKLKSERDVQMARSEALVVENAGLKECAVNYVHAVALWNSWADAEDKISPVPETPATDAFLAEVRAQARREGVNFAAARLAAAFNHGFIDKPTAEVYDVVKAVLGAKEELATAPDDGLSGEYAEQALNDWAIQLRGEKTA